MNTVILASTLLLARGAFASHPAIASISTAGFKLAYQSTGVVPEIVASIDPKVSFYFSYKESDGDHALLMPGNALKLSGVQQYPFEWSVENISNVTEATEDTRYLIYIADVDAPDRANPTDRNFRYYLGGNFTIQGKSSVLSTADLLVNSSLPFTEFVTPNPGLGTGVHRFLSALYVQPTRFNTAGFEITGMDRARENWNLSQWRTQLGLGPAIGATVWTINTTTAATLNAAPSMSYSPYAMIGSIFVTLIGSLAFI